MSSLLRNTEEVGMWERDLYREEMVEQKNVMVKVKEVTGSCVCSRFWGQLDQKEQESRSLLENRREKYSSDNRNISMHGKLF